MGVECLNYRILYLEHTTPTLALPLQGLRITHIFLHSDFIHFF